MCRLVAYLGAPLCPGRPIFDAEHSLLVQSHRPREMLFGTVNADGYGIAWYTGIRSPVCVAASRPIWHAPDLPHLLAQVEAPLFLGVVRDAAPGIPVDDSGLQPMLAGRYAFALNGFIEDFRRTAMRRLHARLPDHLYAELRGVTDTEALFLLARAALERGAAPAEALVEAANPALALARELGIAARLNLLLADGERIAFARLTSDDEANSMYIGVGLAAAPAGTVLASEPLDRDGGWQRVESGTVAELGPEGIREL